MLEEDVNPLRKSRGGEFIFYHELDGEVFFFKWGFVKEREIFY